MMLEVMALFASECECDIQVSTMDSICSFWLPDWEREIERRSRRWWSPFLFFLLSCRREAPGELKKTCVNDARLRLERGRKETNKQKKNKFCIIATPAVVNNF